MEKLKPGFCCPGITDDCMLRCRMCDKWKADKNTYGRPRPTLEEWKRAATQLRELVDEGFEIDIGGGEALLVDWLWSFVRHCADSGFRATIASNGYLVDEEMARKIAGSGLSSIIFSLDSLDHRVHDYWRGRQGVYDRVMRAIENVARFAPDVHIGICSIIMENTLAGMVKLAKWVNKDPRLKSAYYMVPMQPNNTYWGKDGFDKYWFKSKEYGFYWPQNTAKVLKVIDELIRRRRAGELIGNTVVQLEAYKNYLAHPERFVKTAPCNLDRALHISSVGDIFLCYNWPSLGNIRNKEDDLREIWFSEKAEAARKNIRECRENCHFLLNCFFEGDYPFTTVDEHKQASILEKT
ncbi:MAG: radical SAM protein [Candidatus Omnitrophica bacterium]|nr:radical SAM protein [Candidatus Omnitrophota bacterium]